MTTRRFFHSILLGTVVTCLSFPAAAQLKPTGQWLVNSAALEGLTQAAGVAAPCIMANQYDNGFILRLSGGGRQMLSLSIDFRQNAFQKDQRYPATIAVDSKARYSVTGTAFNGGIMIFNVRDAAGLYDAVQEGALMIVSVAGNDVPFSLGNVRAGLQRLEACYHPAGPAGQTQQVAAAAPQAMPTRRDTDIYVKREPYPEFKQPDAQAILKAGNPAAASGIEPFERPKISKSAPIDITPKEMTGEVATASGTTNMGRMGMAAQSEAQTMRSAAPAHQDSMAPMPTDAPAQTLWQANACEDIRSALSRWADQAGTTLVWQADRNGTIAQNVAVRGTFEEAVAQVMADNAAAAGIQSQFADPGAETNSGATEALSASPGEDLRSVVQRWAAQNNVTLKWEAAEPFTLKQPVSGQGDFPTAIEAALVQFDEDATRPVGTLNRDPVSGAMTLTVQMDRAS